MSPRRTLRATLIHNSKAGDACHRRSDIEDLLSRVGYSISCFRSKREEIESALNEPADVIVVAGGDGTVARVAVRAKPGGPPIAVLPFGKANNIARSLGVEPPLDEFVAHWRDGTVRPFYPIDAAGPWGSRRVIEGIGFGAVEEAITDLPHKAKLTIARKSYAEAAISAAPEFLQLRLDGETLVGRFPLLEITTIPFVGPNLRLAAAADPSDRKFEICFIGDSADERQALARWLDPPDDRAAAPVSVRAAERLSISGQFRRIRLDGDVWAVKADPETAGIAHRITLATAPEPLQFLAPL